MNSKKWLYGVALGALLIAQSALGVTVHEVVSNGWWSEDTRATHAYLDEIAPHPNINGKMKKLKVTTDENGNPKSTFVVVFKGPAVAGTRWTARTSETRINADEYQSYDRTEKLTARRHKTYKEKSVDKEQQYGSTYLLGDVLWNQQDTYTVKPLKKDARPMGGYVVEERFKDEMLFPFNRDFRFDGTQEEAITNFVSDSEAYITGTVRQSGYLKSFMGYVIDEQASLLREYTTHITTDVDLKKNVEYVYIDRKITEITTNEGYSNAQRNYEINHVVTFKDGRWKNSRETMTLVSNSQTADWFKEYLKAEENSTATVSVHSDSQTPIVHDISVTQAKGDWIPPRTITKAPKEDPLANAPLPLNQDETGTNAARANSRVRVTRTASARATRLPRRLGGRSGDGDGNSM